ncbi:MAG: Tim44/TimA family putative adaptor protein [Methyloceanibacter sp.]|jgi:predicted lipid-binding transport protein (Tim44 family)
MSEAFDIYTLLFLVLAVVIFIRLRSVLGRRTGNERPPYDPYSSPEPKQGTPEGTVVALPRGRNADTPGPAEVGPSAEDIEERLERYAKADSPLGKSLAALIKADPGFDPAQFLDGAKMAYEMIVAAFAEGDEKTLKQLLGDDVLDGFSRAIAERDERGETHHTTLVGIDKADMIEAELKDKQAFVTVKFVSELISVTRNAEGEVIDGDPKKVREVTDIWTFARDTDSRNPNWKLVATEAAN